MIDETYALPPGGGFQVANPEAGLPEDAWDLLAEVMLDIIVKRVEEKTGRGLAA